MAADRAAADLAAEVDAFMANTPTFQAGGSLDEHMRHLVTFQRALHDAGLAVVSWPERYGGRGLGPDAAAQVAGRLGELGAPEFANFVGIEVLAPAMLRFLDHERLTAWLPPMASAREIWCQLFSEPSAGSDLAALRTRADPDGDGWVVNGQKTWSTWGHYARWGVLLARTGSVEARHRGITAFVVDMQAPGVEARPLRAMTGDAEFAEVFFDDVRIGPSSLIGTVGGGWDVTVQILNSERGSYAVRRAAVFKSALNEVLAIARRTALPPSRRQNVAQAYTVTKLLELRMGLLVNQLARGVVPGPEAALTKQLLTQAEQLVHSVWLDLEAAAGGVLGWVGSTPVAVADYLYSRAASIYGGSQEIQRNVIGERLLGLPREPVG